MSKLERLLKLAEMSRQHQVGTVREMSRLCSVSQRTIFRDLKTLAKLNLPEELRTGAEQTNGCLKALKLDSDERCLLGYILDHNPLMRNGYLAWRLKCIKAKFGDLITAADRKPNGQIVEVDPTPKMRRRIRGDRLTTIFLSACKSNRPLLVKVRGVGGELSLVPHAIRIHSNGVGLSFRAPSSGELVIFDQASIESLRLLKQEP